MSLGETTRAAFPAPDPFWRRGIDEAPSAGEIDDMQFGEMSFGDLIDIVNPLQHIPIVSTIYRAVTGDVINPASRVVGGLIFGGPIGAVFASIGAVIEQASGFKPEDMLAGLFGGRATDSEPSLAATPRGERPPGPAQARAAAPPAEPAPSAPTLPPLLAAQQTASAPAVPGTPELSESQSAALERLALGTRIGGDDEDDDVRLGSASPGSIGPERRDWFPAMMMQALEKYQAAARAGGMT